MTQEILEQLNSLNIDYLTKKIVQEQEKESTGKYKHVPMGADKNGVEYMVDELLLPDGSRGYTIIFYSEIDLIRYAKVLNYLDGSSINEMEWQAMSNNNI